MLVKPEEISNLCTPDGGKFRVDSLESAYVFCKSIALGHYENFPVGSAIVPKKMRKHFFSVYAFSRIADDISDEVYGGNPETEALAMGMLKDFANMINSDEFIGMSAGNPIFIALHNTMNELSIPKQPFLNLLKAFEMDVNFCRADTIDDLLNYCVYSANPVGEIVLRLFGQYNEHTAPLSDKICTGLQLVNFWQDISVDKDKNRIFIPKNIQNKYLGTTENLFSSEKSRNFEECLNELFNYTYTLFAEGEQLVEQLQSFRLRLEIKLTLEGGKKILDKCNRLNYRLVSQRPKLGKTDILLVLLKAITSPKVWIKWR